MYIRVLIKQRVGVYVVAEFLTIEYLVNDIINLAIPLRAVLTGACGDMTVKIFFGGIYCSTRNISISVLLHSTCIACRRCLYRLLGHCSSVDRFRFWRLNRTYHGICRVR